MFNEDFKPSSQTDGYAEEIISRAKEISKREHLDTEFVLEAYRIGAMAQQNDMLYKIACALGELATAPIMGIGRDEIKSISYAIEDLTFAKEE